MIPMVEYTNGQGFGENSMLADKPRAGTAVTKADTHFAVVPKDGYKRFMLKSENEEWQ